MRWYGQPRRGRGSLKRLAAGVEKLMRMKQLCVAINAPLCFGLIVAAVQKNSKELEVLV